MSSLAKDEDDILSSSSTLPSEGSNFFLLIQEYGVLDHIFQCSTFALCKINSLRHLWEILQVMTMS
ncbi:hypothetical protein HI914_05310 [Erysiphe necator]|nr:hypothetical protein HI914_05310 [Erysiphe necator]